MKKISTAAAQQSRDFSQQKLTIGLDLGDRSSWYCVLDAAGQVVLEQKLGTTPKAMKEVFGAMPRCRIALETGMHSQRRGSLSANAARARGTAYSGTVWHGQRSQVLGAETGRARRKEREETRHHRHGTEVGGVVASPVGKRRSVRTAAQQHNSQQSGLAISA
jgi:hypothetical protein